MHVESPLTEGPRTNNHVEGFHSKFNKELGAAHPHIYKLIAKFKNYEKLVKVKFLRMQLLQHVAPTRAKKYVEKDIKINDLIQEFILKKISLEHFINFISVLVGIKSNNKKKPEIFILTIIFYYHYYLNLNVINIFNLLLHF